MAGSKQDVDGGGGAKPGRDERPLTKRHAGKAAPGASASVPLSLEEAKRLRGSGWIGDLGELRSSRVDGPWHRAGTE